MRSWRLCVAWFGLFDSMFSPPAAPFGAATPPPSLGRRLCIRGLPRARLERAIAGLGEVLHFKLHLLVPVRRRADAINPRSLTAFGLLCTQKWKESLGLRFGGAGEVGCALCNSKAPLGLRLGDSFRRESHRSRRGRKQHIPTELEMREHRSLQGCGALHETVALVGAVKVEHHESHLRHRHAVLDRIAVQET